MNTTDRLERELTAWFDDAAAPRVPDYTADILGTTATMRQRSRWSFPARWLPASVALRLPPLALRPVPWRTVALLALLGLLLAAAVTLYIGTRPRLPAPFGPAANGLVAYADKGDIWTVDPLTGDRTAIVVDDSNEDAPRFSRDGTRIAFFRVDGPGVRLVITNADGTGTLISHGRPFINADSDSIVWSPDGRHVAVAANGGGDRTTYLVETTTGQVRDLQTFRVDVEVYWRPPDGRQLMYVSGHDLKRLMLLSVADGTMRGIPLSDPTADIRPGGWTLDGGRFVVHRYRKDRAWTDLLDPDTGDAHRLEIAFGRLSNDGTRIVGFRMFQGKEQLCVMALPDGACDPIASGDDLPDIEHTAGLHWSPDDRWIAVSPRETGEWVLLNPEGGPPITPKWSERGIESWQRLAP